MDEAHVSDMIEVCDLVKTFPTADGREKQAVAGISFRVAAGEIYGLLGEKMTMRFLEIFGGRKIEVPPVKKVREAYKTVSAHMRFDKLMKVNPKDYAAAQVGVELDMTPKQVTVAWAKVRAMLARLEEAVRHVAEG